MSFKNGSMSFQFLTDTPIIGLSIGTPELKKAFSASSLLTLSIENTGSAVTNAFLFLTPIFLNSSREFSSLKVIKSARLTTLLTRCLLRSFSTGPIPLA